MKKSVGLSLLTGILFALALPPFKTGFFAYVALIPFFLLLENRTIGDAFRWGYITGFIMAVTSLFWIGWVTLPGLFGVLLVWPLYIALFAVVHTFLVSQFFSWGYALAPFVWVSIEYLESLTELAFPWNYIGYTQSYYLPLIQYAEYTSVFGVSFWVVLINVILFVIWKSRTQNLRTVVAALCFLALIFLAPLVHGLRTMNTELPEGDLVKISLIQGNRDPNAKWEGDIYEDNFKIYEQLTAKAAVDSPDLVIWPETALPFYLRSKLNYLQRAHAIVNSLDAALLTGIMDFVYFKDGSYDHFNSAIFFQPDGMKHQTYAKMKLVPFSERVPYKTHFPFSFLKSVLWDLGIGDFALGEKVTAFERFAEPDSGMQSLTQKERNVDYRSGVAICYESVFPDHVRKYVNVGADFLIIITNDAWFGKTSAPFQHTQIAVFRAIENRRDIARCANTGITCFIDKFGRVRKQTKLYKEAIVTDNVELNKEITFYTRNGNLFVIFITISSLLFVVLAVIRKVITK